MACGSLVPYQARQRWEILLWHDRGSNHRRIQKLTGERDFAGAEPTDQHELAFLQPRIALETQRGEKKLRESGLLPARRALGSSLTPASSVTLDSVSRRDCWTAARRARRPHLLQRGGARRGWPRRGQTDSAVGEGGWPARWRRAGRSCMARWRRVGVATLEEGPGGSTPSRLLPVFIVSSAWLAAGVGRRSTIQRRDARSLIAGSPVRMRAMSI
jgi:hypothetical protein